MTNNKDENRLTGRSLILNMDQYNYDDFIVIAKALSSPQRLRILDYLTTRVANVSEIAEALGMPLATANLHLTSLEKAGLIRSEMISARRGLQKMCARIFDVVVMHLPRTQAVSDKKIVRTEMPVGGFVDHQVAPTCGLASKNGLIGYLDDPVAFYRPERFEAQLVWLGHGYLEYRFPYYAEANRRPKCLQISMEICSEAVPHHHEWLSDIFLEINRMLVGTWTSPGDFGGERGKLTPEWWDEHNSQYGLLKTWRIDQEGTFIDGRPISKVVINELRLDQQPFIQVRIGVKPDAAHVGGLNIFGREFGNHAQDIILELHY